MKRTAKSSDHEEKERPLIYAIQQLLAISVRREEEVQERCKGDCVSHSHLSSFQKKAIQRR